MVTEKLCWSAVRGFEGVGLFAIVVCLLRERHFHRYLFAAFNPKSEILSKRYAGFVAFSHRRTFAEVFIVGTFIHKAQMLKFGFSVAKSKLLKLFNRVPMPSIAIHFITYRCNLKCRMCSAITYSADEEMNTQQVKDLYDQIKSLQLIRITGGEPFIRNDLPEIMHHIQKRIKPYLIHITTNGTLSDRIVDLVKENKGSKLFIAVHYLSSIIKYYNVHLAPLSGSMPRVHIAMSMEILDLTILKDSEYVI